LYESAVATYVLYEDGSMYMYDTFLDKRLPYGIRFAHLQMLLCEGGIMGGKDTEVTTETKNIILEAAIFDGPSIRRSARALGLTTEAAKRFERGIWMSSPQNALRAARALLHTICGGTLDGDIVSAGASETKAVALTVDLGVYEQRIGRSEKTSELLEALRRFGYTVKGKSSVTLTVPDWRMDVRAVEDILDDLGRVFGYEDLPALFPPSTVIPERFSESVQLKDDLRTALVQLGATEIILHATYGQQALDHVGGEHILVANPLDQTQHALRASLLPGIERVILAEVDAGRDAFVFEIGRVFLGQGGVDEQPWRVGIGFALKVPTGSAIDWELNGKIRALERLLHRAVPASTPSVRVVKGRTIACIEFDLQSFGSIQTIILAPQGLAPAVERDVTIEVPVNMSYEQIQQAILVHRSLLLASITASGLFMVDDRRRVTIRCTFQDGEQTLTTEVVDREVEKIRSALSSLNITISK
jgi:phenylalanyl-tRNA synthetase beta subunit